MKLDLLQEYADQQAASSPAATALVSSTGSITYAELAAKSNQLARLLQEAGCRKGDRVGILLPKSIEAVLSILAILKAGCIYVPMDTSSPCTRLQMILESSGSRFLLATGSSAELLKQLIPDFNSNLILIGWLDAAPPDGIKVEFSKVDLSTMSSSSLPCSNKAGDVAHLLFTSGSTGRPKGVMITHANVRHYVDWAIRYFGYTSSDRVSGHPPLHFDLSTMDIYCALGSGAQLHLVPPHLSLLPHKIADFIRERELTQWFSVPSLLAYMAKFDVVRQDDFPALRRLLWCGERFPTPELIYWMKRLPRVAFTNLYGPTETTIASSYYQVPACPEDGETPIPIGTACEGERLLVLDESLKEAGVGEIADLYIGGCGLSPGYWNDPEKTRAAFLEEPFGPGSERIYKTGDLASVGRDGLVYLHGRIDSQIKSRGYRIELGEIETVLHTTDGIREAAVVAINSDAFEGATICCAFVPQGGIKLEAPALRQKLSQRLPQYMIPTRWACMNGLPLNGNGKVDRPQLRQQFQQINEAAALPALS
jgi:amino acid adenylation domain-containing protein